MLIKILLENLGFSNRPVNKVWFSKFYKILIPLDITCAKTCILQMYQKKDRNLMVHQNTKKIFTKKIINTVLEMYKERQYSHKIRIVPYTFQLLLKNMPKIFVNSRNSIFFQSIDKMFKNFSLIIGAELA